MKRLATFTGLWVLWAAVPAFGQITQVSTPTAPYTSSTIAIPITAADGASVASLVSGTQTVTFSTALTAATVPGGGWSTWG